MSRLEPMVDWIGNWPISHGERGEWNDAVNPGACLCGVEDYWQCPDWLAGEGLAGLAVEPDGTVHDGWVEEA